MKKLLIVSIVFVSNAVFANSTQVLNYCSNLEENQKKSCLSRYYYIWEDISDIEAEYCVNQPEENGVDQCLTIAGCSEDDPSLVMDCLNQLSKGIEKECSFGALQVLLPATLNCAGKIKEQHEAIIDNWFNNEELYPVN